LPLYTPTNIFSIIFNGIITAKSHASSSCPTIIETVSSSLYAQNTFELADKPVFIVFLFSQFASSIFLTI
jgi:hypothetical protein